MNVIQKRPGWSILKCRINDSVIWKSNRKIGCAYIKGDWQWAFRDYIARIAAIEVEIEAVFTKHVRLAWAGLVLLASRGAKARTPTT